MGWIILLSIVAPAGYIAIAYFPLGAVGVIGLGLILGGAMQAQRG